MRILVLILSTTLSILSFARDVTPHDCRLNIKQKVCLVNPREGEPTLDRECLKGSQMYAYLFEEVYDSYPWPLQRMFCSLNKIFIEKKTLGTAYAGINRQDDLPGRPIINAFMGFNEKLLTQKLSLSHWATWKDQTIFHKGPVDRNTTPVDPSGARVLSHSLNLKNDFLFFVMAHELGHLIDFSNELTSEESRERSDNWSQLSWIKDDLPLAEFDYPLRDQLCFYGCEFPLEKNQREELYAQWSNTPFISLYASLSAGQEFAEFLAYYALIEGPPQGHYIIEIPLEEGSIIYNIRNKMKSSLMENKRRYIQNLFHRNDLIYPPLTI